MPIINGVEVERCTHFYKDDYTCDYAENHNVFCIDYKDCHYKQRKRLEQENEKLKKEVKQSGSAFIKKGDYARELEQENNLLKQTLKDKNFVAIVEENKKLLQTLQEIKEIAKEWMNNDWSCFHCRSNMDEKLKEILDLITKAEEE